MNERQTGFSWKDSLETVRNRLVEVIEDPLTLSRDLGSVVLALSCVREMEQELKHLGDYEHASKRCTND